MTRKWGAERVEPLFVDNPRAALTGEPIDVDYVPQAGNESGISSGSQKGGKKKESLSLR